MRTLLDRSYDLLEATYQGGRETFSEHQVPKPVSLQFHRLAEEIGPSEIVYPHFLSVQVEKLRPKNHMFSLRILINRPKS